MRDLNLVPHLFNLKVGSDVFIGAIKVTIGVDQVSGEVLE